MNNFYNSSDKLMNMNEPKTENNYKSGRASNKSKGSESAFKENKTGQFAFGFNQDEQDATNFFGLLNGKQEYSEGETTPQSVRVPIRKESNIGGILEYPGLNDSGDGGFKKNVGGIRNMMFNSDTPNNNTQFMPTPGESEHKENHQEQNIKRSIEIKNGIPTRKWNNSQKANALNLANYTVSTFLITSELLEGLVSLLQECKFLFQGVFGILLFFYDTMFRLEHFLLICHTISIYLSGTRDLEDYKYVIIVAICTLLCSGFLNFWNDKKKRQAANYINGQPVEKFVFAKRHKSFQWSDWASIQIGDVIKVKNNQEMPCDALILNIVGSKQEEQTCYQRGSMWDDAKKINLKKSYQGTMNKTNNHISDSKFVSQISGLVKWEYNQYGFFQGSFKQTDNPAAFGIKLENILRRGCYLSQAQSIICLALNVGDQTMGNLYQGQNYDKLSENQSFYEKKLKACFQSRKRKRLEGPVFKRMRLMQFFSTLFCGCPVILLMLEQFALQKTAMHKFNSSIDEREYQRVHDSFSVPAGFMMNLPYLGYLCMEAVMFFHAYFILWDVNLVPASVNFTNLEAMHTFGAVDSIICSLAAFTSERGNRSIAAFKVGTTICENDCEVTLKEKLKNPRESDDLDSSNSSIGSIDLNRDELDYIPNQVKVDEIFRSKNMDQLDNVTHSDHQNFQDFLLALVLCHQADIIKSQSTDISRQPIFNLGNSHTYKSLYKDDETQLQFAEQFNYQFYQRRSKMITILKQGTQLRYEEQIMRRINYMGHMLTVQVVKSFSNFATTATIYYKGPLIGMLPLIKTTQNYQNDIDRFSKKGIHAIAIVKKELEGEDVIDLIRILTENQSTNYKDNNSSNDQILMNIASECVMVGILGFKNIVNPRNSLVIEEIRKNGIKVFLLSTDEAQNNITDCNAMKLFQDFSTPYNITGDTDRQVEDSLKQCLKSIVDKRWQDQNVDKKDKDFTATSRATSRNINSNNTQSQASSRTVPNAFQQDRSTKTRELDVSENDRKNAVFVSGKSLQHILKDETAIKLFLTICSMCSICVGNTVTAIQKRSLTKAIKQYSDVGNSGYVISVIANQTDKYTSKEADITIGLATPHQQSDILASSDISMKDLYGLSYLLFKHGSLSNRRLKTVFNEFLYRTILTMLIQLSFFICNGFSTVLPYGTFYFTTFMTILTPVQYFMQGILHVDYGYGILNRIFGEYKFNIVELSKDTEIYNCIFTAVFDVMLFNLFVLSEILPAQAHQWQIQSITIDQNNGKTASWQARIVMNGVLLALFQYWRNRTMLQETHIFIVLNLFAFFVTLAFVLEDPYLAGIDMLLKSPNALGTIIFVGLALNVKSYLKLVWYFFVSSSKDTNQTYQNIEDKLFMEEYEDPRQKFEINEFESYKNLARYIEVGKLFSINQNLLRVHRSDSIDQTLDRINVQGSQTSSGRSNVTNVSMINKFNLQLNDINKEIEYNTANISNRQIENYCGLIWTSISFYTAVACFKILNAFILSKQKENNSGQCTEGVEFQMPSNSPASQITSIYWEFTEILVSLAAIYIIRKVKSIRSDLTIYGLIMFTTVMVNTYFVFDPRNPMIQIQFLYTVTFSHMMRLNSFFFVSIVTVASAIWYMNVRISTILESNEQTGYNSDVELAWQVLSVVFYVLFWTYYTYWDEIKRKVNFVTQYRNAKELQKLKSIINILIPNLVRTRITDGKKNFAESQGEVTIIFIDLDDFDTLVNQHTGKELIALLDKVYNAFDQLCEQHGIQKIETVGKTYMACGGLKSCERDIDTRLLGSHHSVRVTDFACSAFNFAKTQTLRFGKNLAIKVGIHTGNVIAGVVGETKPQFSLIGPTVNKTSRVCSKCPKLQILVSKETRQALEDQSNNFTFSTVHVDMKGIGIEQAYTVNKRKYNNRFTLQNKQSQNSPQQQFDPKNPRSRSRISSDNSERQASDNRDSVSVRGPENSFRMQTDGGISQREYSLSLNEDDFDHESVDDSLEEQHIGGNVMKMSDFKDDKQIVKRLAENERYNLVERPRMLFTFDLKEQEYRLFSYLLQQNYSTEFFQQIVKALFDLVVIEGFVWTLFGTENLIVYFIVFFFVGIGSGTVLYNMNKLINNYFMFWVVLQAAGIIFSMAFFFFNGPKVQNLLLKHSQQSTFACFQTIIYISRVIPFRAYIFMQVFLIFTLSFVNWWNIEKCVINLQTYIIDTVLNLIYIVFLLLASHNREMKVRKLYNAKRIIEVEIDKTADLLGKLVPQHVLIGIKNDQKVVDQLDNVTLLYTDMVGFTEFSKNHTPTEVVTLLSRLFSKFDQLCENIGVYKVHTIGDCYVVMGYTGKIAKERRSQLIQIEEAYKVIQVGIEMIRVIQDEQQNKENSLDARKLNMRIGVHTGKVVGGIIGTKLVRYDIFGSDVLIANKMESNGIAGQLCISENTYKLLEQNAFIFDTLYMQEVNEVHISSIDKLIKMFSVEQIMLGSDSSDRENSDKSDIHSQESSEMLDAQQFEPNVVQ